MGAGHRRMLAGRRITGRLRARPRERRKRRGLHLLFRRHDLGQREGTHRHPADARRPRARDEVRRRALDGAALCRLCHTLGRSGLTFAGARTMSLELLMLGNVAVPQMVERAKLAENNGYDAVWVADERFY